MAIVTVQKRVSSGNAQPILSDERWDLILEKMNWDPRYRAALIFLRKHGRITRADWAKLDFFPSNAPQVSARFRDWEEYLGFKVRLVTTNGVITIEEC